MLLLGMNFKEFAKEYINFMEFRKFTQDVEIMDDGKLLLTNHSVYETSLANRYSIVIFILFNVVEFDYAVIEIDNISIEGEERSKKLYRMIEEVYESSTSSSDFVYNIIDLSKRNEYQYKLNINGSNLSEKGVLL